MEYTVENVETAVHQFYSDLNLQQQVHKWLTLAQVSPQAWDFSWQLLTPDKNVTVQFFGANSLHVKISRYWHEVPVDQYETLQSRLFEKLIQFTAGPKLIQTRLCVAMSSLALHLMPEYWLEPVKDMITRFQQGGFPGLTSLQLCHVLLEMLTVLPEEFFSINLTQHKRGLLRNELSKSLNHVLSLVKPLVCPSSSPQDIVQLCLRCLASWVEFGIPLPDAEAVVLQVFQCIENEDLFDTAIDTLVSVFSQADCSRYEKTLLRLLPHVLQTQEKFQRAAIQGEEGCDVCQGICRLVLAFGENHSKLLVDSIAAGEEPNKANSMTLINMAMACTSLPGHYPVDETCSDMAFNFWYVLQDDITGLDTSSQPVVYKELHPVYFILMERLFVKAQYPDDQVYEAWSAGNLMLSDGVIRRSEWPRMIFLCLLYPMARAMKLDVKEQFRCYRQDVGDTMMYAFNIVREPILGHMCRILHTLLEFKDQQPVRWQIVESIFFLFFSVAECVLYEECVYLPTLFTMLPQVAFNNINLTSTALYMLGAYGEWMSCHPECIGAIIPFLLEGVKQPEVATSASMALKDLTRETLNHIRPYAHQILTVCKEAIDSGKLKAQDCARLMSCVGQVLCCLPFTDIMDYLNQILAVHIQQFQQLAHAQPSMCVKSGILLKLNMLSFLFISLNTDIEAEEEDEDNTQKISNNRKDEPKPVMVVLQQILPIIQIMLPKWVSDSAIVESVCSIFKRALRTLLTDFTPLSNDVIQMLSQMYQAVPHASVLDVSKQLIVLFGNDAEFSQGVSQLLNSVCDKTLILLQNTQGIQQHTEIIEHFMVLLAQILKKTSRHILKGSHNISGIFQAGVVGMCLPENMTVKASCSFLCELIQHSVDENPVVKHVITSEGQILTEAILRALGGESPRGVMDHISDVLFTLSKQHPDCVHRWLSSMIDRDGFPSMRVSRTDKENFVKSLFRQQITKRITREKVKEFSLMCRGLLGTEYAMQAASMI